MTENILSKNIKIYFFYYNFITSNANDDDYIKKLFKIVLLV